MYLFYGSDVERVREKAFEWIRAARKKQPEVAYVRLAKEDLTLAALEDAASAGGLFVKRLLVLLDDPFAKSEEESASSLEEHLDMLAKSDNAIVILAPKLAASRAKKIAAKAAKAYVFDAKEREKEKGFNVGLVNALASRNRERLWLEVVRALRAGDAPEMLHGLMHWKARNLMERGSPDARALSLELLELLNTSRHKGLNLALSLEKFALSL
ncbi:hypothetical protein A3H77_02100 [Candidatus Kaiserbacteria bacterium RIFCSPLOWO2_02_FULL_56_11]|uniref:DNA polymerase III delta N-terminal domain-containing protein n=2 Tax=Candidatus Kaiseribacteriota TaxID=1752734 RepID=A0A1F6E2L9_9BACT|nr:MAG: hypothetical protein A3C95_00215 [Candidatus Kaiserbacteria bacterium RIFCSPHIGHO2_02_FULL_56_30]OGG72234.1 MAG: hypothetical protein A3E65_01945 [Candidatus Kaiserbacteria bacterium RIFCSPHIGHO2_12_FULL_56_13]OGG82235.1 MAG: hypothetical protein A3H77_02100 [Candidatus Kaiserbacteria bacterium RIFCSPLOWO2_02_FULL_56_11]